MLKDFARRPGVQAFLARLIAAWLRFALRTTRWTVEGAANAAEAAASGRAIAAFWHETLPLMPALFRHARRAHPGLRVTALASRHHDGRLLGEIMRALGAEVVHGSSRRHDKDRDRGGAAGAIGLLDAIAGGSLAVITPDGPRGPPRQAASGVAQLAGLSGVPVLPCGAAMRHCIRLGTWDRMILPLPFGRGTIVCGKLIPVPRENWQVSLPVIETALTAAAIRAAAAC